MVFSTVFRFNLMFSFLEVLESENVFRDPGNHEKINEYKKAAENDQLYLQEVRKILKKKKNPKSKFFKFIRTKT